MSVKLGDRVKDKVTGFEGIAVSRHSYLNGCDRINVQPLVDKDGKIPEDQTFDEPQLVVTKAGYYKLTESDLTGGSEKHSDRGKLVSKR